MGNTCCPNRQVTRRRLALLLVGLDNAGKTVTAKGLAGEPIDYPVPTIGFSVIELKYLDYTVRIFDLGGSPNIRGIWYKYFSDIHGVIFVVDSCDIDRFKEVRQVLEEIVSNEKVTGKPLLILANKQDKESALDEIDIIECLEVEKLANKYRCPTLVQSCSANETNYKEPDPGIKEGYLWIVNYIDKNFDKLDLRVKIDMVEQELKEKEDLLNRIQRITAEREAARKSQDPDAIQTYSEYVSNLNGQVVRELEVEDLFPNPEESLASSTNSTGSSSIVFPAIYHLANQPMDLDRERPKSAVQIVKHQLQMNKEVRRSYSAKTRRNKTAPVKHFEAKEFMPRSESAAGGGEMVLVKPQRVVKTAGDRVYTISNGNVGPGGDYYRPTVRSEVFEMEGKFQVKPLAPLKVRSKAQVNKEDDRNGICVVDVE